MKTSQVEKDEFFIEVPNRDYEFDFSTGEYPSTVRWKSQNKSLSISDEGTHFIFCTAGSVEVVYGDNNSHILKQNCYGCVSNAAIINGPGSALISSRLGYRGLNTFGGPTENMGRLRYIDGCSSTVLIAPPKKGDPCFNYLYIPAGINQTAHTHPTLRVGYILEGNGIIKLEDKTLVLQENSFFCLPPDMLHSFHTNKESLKIVIYHPDSEVGPSDEEHPMLNRTIVDGIPANIFFR